MPRVCDFDLAERDGGVTDCVRHHAGEGVGVRPDGAPRVGLYDHIPARGAVIYVGIRTVLVVGLCVGFFFFGMGGARDAGDSQEEGDRR